MRILVTSVLMNGHQLSCDFVLSPLRALRGGASLTDGLVAIVMTMEHDAFCPFDAPIGDRAKRLPTLINLFGVRRLVADVQRQMLASGCRNGTKRTILKQQHRGVVLDPESAILRQLT